MMRTWESITIFYQPTNGVDWKADNGRGLSRSGTATTVLGARRAARRALRQIRDIERHEP